jgi:hypothetical protein
VGVEQRLLMAAFDQFGDLRCKKPLQPCNPFRALLRNREPGCHLVETSGQIFDLVAGRDLDLMLEVPGADLLRSLPQEPDRSRHSEYYGALGEIITRYEATLTCMLLLNAPMPCPEPAVRGVQMAVEMQGSMRPLLDHWRSRGHTIGFGVGLAKGPATVGRIGYEGRAMTTTPPYGRNGSRRTRRRNASI